MNVKPIVASLVALGVSSSIAFAGQAVTAPDHVDAMKAKIARLEAVLDQNQGQAYSFAQLPLAGWQDRVTVSGMVNADAWVSGNTPALGNKFANVDTSSSMGVSGALFVDAEVNCWTTAHVALNYFSDNGRISDMPRINDNLNATGNGINLDEAYITVSNFAKSPVYARVGRQYVDFGNYYRYPITASFTQLLSQTRATALTVGFNDASGFQASAYLFRGIPELANANRTRLNNGGVNLSYRGAASGVHYMVDAGWINSMADVSTINATVGTSYTTDKVGGLSLHGDIMYANMDASVDYVTALRNFNSADLTTSGGDARPHALAIDAGYSFASAGLPSRVGAGYNRSWQADGIGGVSSTADSAQVWAGAMPRSRWYAQYGVEIGRNTDLTFQLVSDKNYNTPANGSASGRTSTTGVLRLGVRFA